MTIDWQQLTEKHGELVWRVVFRILRSHADSLDCFQEVMMEAFQSSQNKVIENWPGFLQWIAVRRGIDRLRQRQRQRIFAGPGESLNELADTQTIAGSVELSELKLRLRNELTSLPAPQAQAFWLRLIEEMSYAEIANQMNIPRNQVGVLIHRARAQMRIALSDLEPNETSSRELSR